jgi:hypothetical protein
MGLALVISMMVIVVPLWSSGMGSPNIVTAHLAVVTTLGGA